MCCQLNTLCFGVDSYAFVITITEGVAYDSHRDIFYWSIDGGSTNLRRLTGGSTLPDSQLPSVSFPSSVALDYIGQRLYWIENNGVCILCVL